MKRRKWDVAAPQAVSGSAASPQAAVVPGIAPMALPSSAIPGGLPNAGAGAPARLSGGVDLQMIQRIQAQAAAVASRLNQDAMARGVAIPQAPAQDPNAFAAAQFAQMQQQQAAAAAQAAATQALQQQVAAQAAAAKAVANIKAEVTFNNAPPRTRHHLAKRNTQQELETKWRVVVVVRGRYCAPGAQPASDREEDRPLFLRITPSNNLPMDPQWRHHACDMCAADITAIITGRPRPMPQPPAAAGAAPGTVPPPAPPAVAPTGVPPVSAGGSAAVGATPAAGASSGYPTAGPGWACLYLRCDAAPAEFGAADRLRGPAGSYLQHIQTAMGEAASVAVAGRGSGGLPEGPEPLHLHLACLDAGKQEEGRRLAANLIDTIRGVYSTAYPSLPPPPASGQYDPPPPPVPLPPAAPTAAPWQQQQQQLGVAPATPAVGPVAPAPPPPLGGGGYTPLHQQQAGQAAAYSSSPSPLPYSGHAHSMQPPPPQQQHYQQQQQQAYQHPPPPLPQQYGHDRPPPPEQQQQQQQGQHSSSFGGYRHQAVAALAGTPPDHNPAAPQQQHRSNQTGHYNNHQQQASYVGAAAAGGYGSAPATEQLQQQQAPGQQSRSPYAGYGGGGYRAPPRPPASQAGTQQAWDQRQPAQQQPKPLPPPQQQQLQEPEQPPAKRRFTEAKTDGPFSAQASNPYQLYQQQAARSSADLPHSDSRQHHLQQDKLNGQQAAHAHTATASVYGSQYGNQRQQHEPLSYTMQQQQQEPPSHTAMGPPPPRPPRQQGAVLPGMDAYAD
ncbi:hypothetical protein ACK3TF_004533 [Chlorella vulgaris]